MRLLLEKPLCFSIINVYILLKNYYGCCGNFNILVKIISVRRTVLPIIIRDMLRRSCLSAALFFLMLHPLFAQENNYQFSQLDVSNGLSSNQINSIYKDTRGFMWFGTASGLNRYDGYEFKVYKHRRGDNGSLIDNYIEGMYAGPDNKLWIYTHLGFCEYDPVADRFSSNVINDLHSYGVFANNLKLIKGGAGGSYWFITADEGIYCYHPDTKKTAFYGAVGGSSIVLHSNSVSDVVTMDANIAWIIYTDGVIDKIDLQNHKILSRTAALADENTHRILNYRAVADSAQNLWIYVLSSAEGLFRLNTKTNVVSHFSRASGVLSLNSSVITSVVPKSADKIWVGTDSGGINIIDTKDNKVSYVMNRMDDQKSLRGNCALLYRDNTGIIWAGTFKEGISYYHPQIIKFPLVRHYMLDASSLPDEDVDCFAEDAAGNLWIGTNGGGLMFYNIKTKRYTVYKHNSADPNSLTNDVVVSLHIDHNNKLWIGTYFGGVDRMEGNRFVHYKHKDGAPGSISDDRVFTILEDASSRLWFGTFTGGLNIYDPKTDSFIHPRMAKLSDYTAKFYEDRQNNIWIARDRGIDVIESNGQHKQYVNEPGNNNSLVANDVNDILQDKTGLYWIATKEGLSILNARTGRFINLQDAQGLPSNNVKNILEDNEGHIWLSTTNGLAAISLARNNNGYTYQIHKYSEMDGLQGREFNVNAAFKTRNGSMIFGGPNGFNWFNPLNISTFSIKPQLTFTDFQVSNNSVNAGDTINGKVILVKSISYTHDITLTHSENAFSISFADCDYFNPGKITYQYKLEGFDTQWLTANGNLRRATYTNLDAGDYTFKVRAININQPGEQSAISMHIRILPPFWKTTFAYFLYLAAIAGILLYIRHRGIIKLKREFERNQEKLENERKIAREREEAHRLHELDLMKIKFFTNVSHEFRTPLSLIISPIDTLIKSCDKPEKVVQLQMIKRNGKRLLNLVNQLLDFRKMESKELKLNLQKDDIVGFISEVSASFTDMAEHNHINYLFESLAGPLCAKFDHDKIERILFNLLSNAFKFTASGGNISVLVNVLDQDAAEPEKKLLEIKVMDTGIGIPKEKQERIFEPFFQVNLPENMLNQGSGIGLSITHEFVKMHSGTIRVESEPDNGSCFIVQLPLNAEEDMQSAEPANRQISPSPKSAVPAQKTNKKPVVLLIEDNDDMRFYLKDNLKNTFNIVEAVNGREGWQKALALHPNLIVSDVSMPEMSGVELCKKIRDDYRTNHIPIILLTALTEEKDQLAGLTNGANDYITKPFNFEILLSKINGLLSMQENMKNTYQKQKEIQVEDMVIVSEDEKFLQNVFACIEKNLTNYNFSVEELSSQMALSRVSLYKKMLTLTGKTPVDCIRTVRLKKAVQLLEKSQLNIASIAYEVGFNNPTYFSKVFKDEYGSVPSEYIANLRKQEKEPAQID